MLTSFIISITGAGLASRPLDHYKIIKHNAQLTWHSMARSIAFLFAKIIIELELALRLQNNSVCSPLRSVMANMRCKLLDRMCQAVQIVTFQINTLQNSDGLSVAPLWNSNIISLLVTLTECTNRTGDRMQTYMLRFFGLAHFRNSYISRLFHTLCYIHLLYLPL